MSVNLLTAVVAAFLALVGQRVIQSFIARRTHEREQAMHRAGLAATAFTDFFEVINRCQTIEGTIRNAEAGYGPPIEPALFVKALDDLGAARARLAAVASPPVVAVLAHLDREGGPGFSSSTEEARNALTDVMVMLREDLGVTKGQISTVERAHLRELLFN